MKRNRYVVRSYGDNEEAVREGLIKMLQLLGGYNSAVIVVPRLKDVKATILAKVLGDEYAKQLIKNRTIPFQGGKAVHLCSDTTLQNVPFSDIYLVLWGSEEMISNVEKLPAGKEIIVVTWQAKEVENWEAENIVSVIYDDKKG